MNADDFAERIRRIRTMIRDRAPFGNVDPLFSEILTLIEIIESRDTCEECDQNSGAHMIGCPALRKRRKS